MNYEQAQKKFYQHLKMHPSAHKAAKTFAEKLAKKDPEAVAALKSLAERAGSDPAAANALRIISVTMKFEEPESIIAGGLPATAGKAVKVALAPAAWVLASAGHVFHWTGRQFQHFARYI